MHDKEERRGEVPPAEARSREESGGGRSRERVEERVQDDSWACNEDCGEVFSHTQQ